MNLIADADPHIGRTLGGQYRIEALLGSGGMGRVYRGVQLSVNRPVAIKLITGTAPHPAEWVQRFQREAEATARLSHPNSVRLFDFGVTEAEELYMVMELLEGTDLARQICEHGRLILPDALSITRQVLLALSEAHALGIVHRDIKPDNVFLARVQGGDLVAKVMDFGIAGLEQSSLDSKLTGTGIIIGTPTYMSPEQAQGLAVDGRSDLYSLGVVLFEMLTGEPVFESDTAMKLLLAHISQPPRRLSQCGIQVPHQAGVQTLLDGLLAKDPQARPSVHDALEAVAALSTSQVAKATLLTGAGSLQPRTSARLSRPLTAARPSGSRPATADRPRALTGPGFEASQVIVPKLALGRRWTLLALCSALLIATGGALAWSRSAATPATSRPKAKTAEAPASAPLHAVTIHSDPSGANVHLNGTRLGSTPYVFHFQQPAQLSVSRRGYERQLVDVAPSGEPSIELKLVRESGPNAAKSRPARASVGGGPEEPVPDAKAGRDTWFSAQLAELRAEPPEVPVADPAPPSPAPPTAAPLTAANDGAPKLEPELPPVPAAVETSRSTAIAAAPQEERPTFDLRRKQEAPARVQPPAARIQTPPVDDDEEVERASRHHSAKVFTRIFARVLGKFLIPEPSRERRAALADEPLAYKSFSAVHNAFKQGSIDRYEFQDAVWQLRQRRRHKILAERENLARGSISKGQYDARVDRIWEDFWGG